MNTPTDTDTVRIPTPPAADRPSAIRHFWPPSLLSVILFYGIAALLVFGDLLVSPTRVVSAARLDIWGFGLDWWTWGANELRNGNLPLWNPYILGGSPFFASGECSPFYLPNFLFLILPVPVAFAASFALHTMLGGLFMHVWLMRRKLHLTACLAGGLMFMFCAPFFLRAYAGHTTVHSAIAWIPLVFLVVEALITEASLGWTLVGTLVMAMFLFAGYPQVVFYTGILAGLYALVRLPESPGKLKTLAAMAGMNILAIGLWAVQVGASLALAQECSRSGGVPYAFAATFSFPPENWLTFLSPNLFGDRVLSSSDLAAVLPHFQYWGRCYFWEMTPFFGVCGLPLVVTALFRRDAHHREIRSLAGCAGLGCLFAMGSHLPWFQFLYDHVPGFAAFRGNSKFIIPAVTLLIGLAATGMDAVAASGDDHRTRRSLQTLGRGLWVAGGSAGLLAAAALVANRYGELWKLLFHLPVRTGEALLVAESFYQDPRIIDAAALFFVFSLVPACLILLLLRFALGRTWNRQRSGLFFCYVLLAVIAADMITFAWRFRTSFPLPEREAVSAPLRQFLATHPGDHRILSATPSNAALPLRAFAMWGYGTQMVVRRYGEFLAWTQGDDPNAVTGYQAFRRVHPRFDLMRCRYFLIPKEQAMEAVEIPNPLPRFLLVPEYRAVAGGRDAVFAELSHPEFDPRQTVILEQTPAPEWQTSNPEPGSRTESPAPTGQIRLLRESTDWQEMEVSLPRPAIFLQTDLYTPSWMITALPGSSQSRYELLPADYILRGIPLSAGTHRFRIEYRPQGFVVGQWLSVTSLLLLGVLALFWGWRRSGARNSGQPLPRRTGYRQ